MARSALWAPVMNQQVVPFHCLALPNFACAALAFLLRPCIHNSRLLEPDCPLLVSASESVCNMAVYMAVHNGQEASSRLLWTLL